jgi:hypothetical protein
MWKFQEGFPVSFNDFLGSWIPVKTPRKERKGVRTIISEHLVPLNTSKPLSPIVFI